MKKLFIYDSFTKEEFKGNPAGVVFIEKNEKLEEKIMQKIAKELGYPETVFIFFQDDDKIKVRFFTPKEEVDLCGHATIAYATALVEEKKIKVVTGINKIIVETNLGDLPLLIEMGDNEIKNVMMYQASPKIEKDVIIEPLEIADALGISKENLGEIPIVKGYTGIMDLMIEIKNPNILNLLKPNMKKIEILSKKLGVISFHIYALGKVRKIHARNFAPIVDIPEEAATGTSNGALTYYLHTLGMIKENEVLEIIQGEAMNRESKILGKIISENGKKEVLIGGNAIRLIDGKIGV